MTMEDKKALVERVSRLVEDVAAIAGILDQALIPDGETPDVSVKAHDAVAEKSRAGFRAEVKAILTAHGVTQLSDVRDPKALAAIVAEASAL